MLSTVDCYVIARESNVVRVDFNREPDPPAPYFPGANGLRLSNAQGDGEEAPSAELWRNQKNSARRLEWRTQLPKSVCG